MPSVMTPSIELATKLDAFIVTNDRQLIARLRRSRIKIILLKGGNHLALDTEF